MGRFLKPFHYELHLLKFSLLYSGYPANASRRDPCTGRAGQLWGAGFSPLFRVSCHLLGHFLFI